MCVLARSFYHTGRHPHDVLHQSLDHALDQLLGQWLGQWLGQSPGQLSQSSVVTAMGPLIATRVNAIGHSVTESTGLRSDDTLPSFIS